MVLNNGPNLLAMLMWFVLLVVPGALYSRLQLKFIGEEELEKRKYALPQKIYGSNVLFAMLTTLGSLIVLITTWTGPL